MTGTKQAQWHIVLLKLVIHTMTVTCGIFGLCSHYYQQKRDHYYKSKWLMAYSILAMLTFAAVYLSEIYDDYLTDQMDLTNVNKLNNYMNIIAVLCSYITGLLLHEAMPAYMNAADLTNTITFFGMTSKMTSRPLLMVVVRGIIFPVTHELVLIVRQWHNEPEKSILWTLYHLLPTVISQIMPSCAYGVLEMWKMYLSGIIAKLQNIRNEVNRLQTRKQMRLHKAFYRMQRFCDLSDRLDELLQKYMEVSTYVLQYAEMYAVPMLCALFCNMLGILVGLYVQYGAIADAYTKVRPYDAFNAMTNATYLFMSIIQFVLLANTTNQNMEVMRSMGYILQDIELEHADVRFVKSVDLFSLLCHTYKFKVTPLGLFEINISILHEVSAAITGFLLILIQSDLTLRFL